jgi:hypothetical protein
MGASRLGFRKPFAIAQGDGTLTALVTLSRRRPNEETMRKAQAQRRVLEA